MLLRDQRDPEKRRLHLPEPRLRSRERELYKDVRIKDFDRLGSFPSHLCHVSLASDQVAQQAQHEPTDQLHTLFV
jgi:hypothetical protein